MAYIFTCKQMPSAVVVRYFAIEASQTYFRSRRGCTCVRVSVTAVLCQNNSCANVKDSFVGNGRVLNAEVTKDMST